MYPFAEVLQKININNKNIPLCFFNRYDCSKIVSIGEFRVRYELTDDEIIDYALKYFARGITYETEGGFTINWRGLDEMVP